MTAPSVISQVCVRLPVGWGGRDIFPVSADAESDERKGAGRCRSLRSKETTHRLKSAEVRYLDIALHTLTTGKITGSRRDFV